MLTTRELLTETLERLFGKVTVRVNRFEGRGREPLGFSANYFCNECLRARGDTTPINGMARDRVIDMSRRVLAGKTDYDVWQFSNAVSELLFDLFGVETAEFAIDSEGDALRTKKAFAQAALLSRMLRMAEGKAKVDEAAVARALERTAETRRRALGGFGPERFYESAPFPLTSRFPFRMVRATEDRGKAWELHRPSARPSSSRRPWSWAPMSWCSRAQLSVQWIASGKLV